MSRLRILMARFVATLTRRRDQQLTEEFLSHLDLLAAEHERRGMSASAAREAAFRDFGGVQQTKEAYREQRGLQWLDDLGRDVRHAARGLVKTPSFTAAAVVTLALGIGANSAIFSVVHALLLKPLPYATGSDRLVRLMVEVGADESPTGAPFRYPVSLSHVEAAQVQSVTETLSDIGTVAGITMRLTDSSLAARLQGARVSSSIFHMLDARPWRGRVFDPGDDVPGGEGVVILGYEAWQRLFRGDVTVVGRTVTLTTTFLVPVQRRYVVIGVMPPGFAFPDSQAQFWIPPQDAMRGRAPARDPMFARLAKGVSIEAAGVELEPIVRRVRDIKPSTGITIVREQDEIAAPVRPALTVLMVAVGFVLLIACVNVANLLLARTAGKRREIAIRTAIGAGRMRLVRQALTESVLLALIGGVAAIGLALAAVRLLRRLATTLPRFDLANGVAFPRLDEISLGVPVLVFTITVALVTGVLFGLAPAFRQYRYEPADALRDTSQAGEFGLLHGLRGRGVLMVAEIALATVLLVGAGLLIQSFTRLMNVSPGYEAANVLTFQVDLPADRFPNDRVRAFAEELVSRVRSIPGVKAAASGNQLPLVNMRDTAGGLWRTPDKTRGMTPKGDCRVVSRDYLSVMGIRVLAGRGFLEGDGAGQPQVVLINRALARAEFNTENPIGQAVYIGGDPEPWTVVGVVEDVRQFGLDRPPEPQFFVDLRQWSPAALHLFPIGAYFAVRTDRDAAEMSSRLQTLVRQLDSQATVFNVASMDQLVSNTITRPRMYAVLVGVFAAVGAALAVIGIYGVVAYSVVRRTREIGIRLALGARRMDVIRMVLQHTLAFTAVGLCLGLMGAAALARYLETLLFEVTPLDPATFVGVSVLFAGVALLAAFVPARRATRVDPLIALRYD